MSFELPPERQLPNREQMLDEILIGDAAPSNGRRNRWIGIAAAAAVAITATTVGVSTLGRGPEVGANPPVGPTSLQPATPPAPGPTQGAKPSPTPPSAAPTPSTSTTSTPRALPKPQNLGPGDSAEFEYFSITIGQTDRKSGVGVAVWVETCILETPPGYPAHAVPIGWYPWSAESTDGPVAVGEGHEMMNHWTPGYGANGTYKTGSCAAGWLPFRVSDGRELTKINYANDYGDKATWTLGPGSDSPGGGAFENFDVTMSDTDRDESRFAVKVRVCVTSLPKGTSGETTRLSREPWTLITAKGKVKADKATATGSWEHLFPVEGTYAVGECADGWLPFAVAKGVKVTNVTYQNSLGDAVSWPLNS